MKNLFLFSLICIVATVQTSLTQEQISEPPDWIRQQEFIPIVIPNLWWDWVKDHYADVEKMKDSAGVNVVRNGIERQGQIDTLTVLGFQVIPDRTLGLNYIQYYTDAKYSIWEAEGTPLANGDATLEPDLNKTTVIPGNPSYLKLNSTAVDSVFEMIKGPYYIQEDKYNAFLEDSVSIDAPTRIVGYTADYEMKLEWNIPRADTNASFDSNTPICKVQVTQSYVASTTPWQLGCQYPIIDTVLTLEKFTQLNQWKKFSFNYTLVSDSCTGPTPPSPPKQHHPVVLYRNGEAEYGLRSGRDYIQFKVIWLGNPDFLLSIDKVTISDARGMELFDTLFTPNLATQFIQNQAGSLNNYNSYVAGWLGIDEPTSIDIFAPIKRVTEILDDYSQRSRPLWLPWMGHWDGAWNNRNDPFIGLSPWTEFKKRVGRANIIQNFYMFDYPYCDTCTNPVGVDWRVVNIDIAAELNYKQAYALDPYWGASIQAGKILNPQARQRDVNRTDVLYNANLALMYGAKFIELWNYFAHTHIDDCASGKPCRGIVNILPNGALQYTDKYDMLRDTLNPRLKGLFGKTIKKLKPINQFAGTRGINALIYPQELTTPYECVKSIQTIGGMNDECFVELGIFQDLSNTSAKYFMPINRYYSNKSILTFNLRYLTGYNNWQIYDYVDTTHISIVSNNGLASFVDTIFAGDAKLYSVMPVVQNGGVLSENEFLTSDETLKHDMLIDANTELTISPDINYTVKDTITLVDGSFITGDGYVILDTGAAIQIFDWSKSVFRSVEDNHPKIIWGAYSTTDIVEGYNIYRKWNQDYFSLIGSTAASTLHFTDEDVEIYVPAGEEPKNAEYYVTAIINFEQSSEESDPSNTIDYWVDKAGKMNTGVNSEEFVYELGQNYPNPFNPTTLITYGIKNNGFVTLKIYDILGREIKTLVNDYKAAGNYNINFDASDLASGIYIYQLKAGDFISSKKMTLVK